VYFAFKNAIFQLKILFFSERKKIRELIIIKFGEEEGFIG